MRRVPLLVTLLAALSFAGSAGAAIQPIRHALPRVRPGTITIPKGHASGRVRVIVRLKLPPLAVERSSGTEALVSGGLALAGRSSQAYLARLGSAQAAAVAQLRAAIPQATVSRRFRIVLDGLTVTLPAKRLPQLVRLPFVSKVYPSLRFKLNLNESPSVIGAEVIEAATGARGDGVKIGVVDDGVDPTNPFFNPAGFSYPAGFPRGETQFTTPKVIVARAFPGPNSGKPGQLALDRSASFHGTHVSGIAAGDAGTNAPPGRDHPAVSGLTGIAPRAWIGNYRVFNAPTPAGNSAFTPEIVAAFEAAAADGMDVINFSGGGPENDPANDALQETIHNLTLAGTVVVIAAGNDRAEFGLGSVGTPGTAPDAITVAAVSNTHVFSAALTVQSPSVAGGLPKIPFEPSFTATPPTWEVSSQTLVDVGAITGTNGRPVDRRLCAPGPDPNGPGTTLPAHSLDGAIALASRGDCAFTLKAQRAKAAGAVGIVYVNNRPGETQQVPVQLSIPGGMIADLDGGRLRAAMQASGGRAQIRITVHSVQIETGRAGVPAFFSSAGPTSFTHELKPDIAAPGQQILSSTLPEFAGSPFAVFDGTSMATPHIAGAAAILVQLHPAWTPLQVKSALMATAHAAYADTAKTAEAPVLLEGAGLAYLPAANDPMIFTDPQSVSLHDVDVNHGAQVRGELVTLSDAGTGSGTWSVEIRPQAATRGVYLDLPPTVALAPGGTASLPVAAKVAADADAGEQFGFIVLRQGAIERRIPYFFLVTRPALESVSATPLTTFQVGNTTKGLSRAGIYRFPSTPFGPAANFVGPPMDESGAEKLYTIDLKGSAANVGVSIVASSRGSLIDPYFLGAKDENDVQGYSGTPVNVNSYMFDYRLDVGAAGAQFPRQKQFYVSVDSQRNPATGKSFAGSYLMRAWVNDVTPPAIRLLTTKVAAGRPTIIAQAADLQSGVDPFSLVLGYGRILVGAAGYDPFSGLIFFPLPPQAKALPVGKTVGIVVASDYQETKNLDQAGDDVMPNTSFLRVTLRAVNGPTVTWLAPETGQCAAKTQGLVVDAGSTKPVREVRFLDGKRTIGVSKRGSLGLYAVQWKTGRAAKGVHTLRAVVLDSAGRQAAATRRVPVCAKK